MSKQTREVTVPKIASQVGDAPLYEVLRDIVRRVSTYVNERFTEALSSHNAILGRSEADAHPASSVTNTPAGNIAATTVQAALDELDTEKIAGSGTTGTLAKFTAAGVVGGSVVTESASKIGVNTANYTGVLNSATTSTTPPVYGEAIGTSVSPFLLLQRARGTTGSKTAVQLNDYIGGLQGQGYDGSAYITTTGGACAFLATENWSGTVNGTAVVFVATTTGTKTAYEALRLQDGYVQVGGGGKIFSGTGSPEGVVTAGVGSIFMRTDGGAGTSIYCKESGSGNTGWVGK